MHLHELSAIPTKEYVPGFHGKMIHTAQMTLAYWQIEAGASLPEHAHHHEQVVNVLKGEFELIVDGISHHLKAGMVYVLPGGTPHAGHATTDCELLDVFQPVREDYRDL
ncbi:MAG: cupin domain-containing protein [Bacteroidota bacterium]